MDYDKDSSIQFASMVWKILSRELYLDTTLKNCKNKQKQINEKYIGLVQSY